MQLSMTPRTMTRSFRALVIGLTVAVSLAGLLASSPANAKGGAFCKDYIKLSTDKGLATAMSSLSDQTLIQKDPKKAKANIHKVTIAFRDLQKNAPAKVKPDLIAVEKFFSGAEVMVDKVAKAATDPKGALDAATAMSKSLPKLNTAITNLTKYTATECGV